MVMRVVFHCDFGSPNAYLSYAVIPRIEQRTGTKSSTCRSCPAAVNTLALMRGAIAAQRIGVLAHYVDQMFGHMWVQPDKAAIMESRK
jgi:2-hydroxychromene-2-carboxylate isomerase